ncbi:hypothetical protein Agub_g9590, partial [Astrephomene gubernaculifera]
ATTDALLAGASAGSYPLYVLFPGAAAQDLRELSEREAHTAALERAAARLRMPAPAANTATEAVVGSYVSAPRNRQQEQLPEYHHDQQPEFPEQQQQQQQDQRQCQEQQQHPMQQQQQLQQGPCCESAAGRELCQSPHEPQVARQQGNQQGTLAGTHASEAASAASTDAETSCSRQQGVPEHPHGSLDRHALRVCDQRSASIDQSVDSSSSGGGCSCTCSGGAGGSSSSCSCLTPPSYLLVVIDGTWRQAREMFRAVSHRCLLPSGPGVQVALGPADILPPAVLSSQPVTGSSQDGLPGWEGQVHDASPTTVTCTPASDASCKQHACSQRCPSTEVTAGDKTANDGKATAQPQPDGTSSPLSDPRVDERDDATTAAAPLDYDPNMPCLIRKEPVAGFVTTYEATARALGLLEQDAQLASELLAPLRLMTRLQAGFSPAVRSRMCSERPS